MGLFLGPAWDWFKTFVAHHCQSRLARHQDSLAIARVYRKDTNTQTRTNNSLQRRASRRDHRTCVFGCLRAAFGFDLDAPSPPHHGSEAWRRWLVIVDCWLWLVSDGGWPIVWKKHGPGLDVRSPVPLLLSSRKDMTLTSFTN